MSEPDFFRRLYLFASHLNKAFSLGNVLNTSLEKAVELLEVKTGWIWLAEANQSSVYLAASYNLPPALRNHPERLSGFCYCIKQYFGDDLEGAKNVSEITCSRLLDIKSGTENLKYHAVIPIKVGGHRVGIMNLLSKENRQLDSKTLELLNAISELIGNAIQRVQMSNAPKNEHEGTSELNTVTEKLLFPQLNAIIQHLEGNGSNEQKLREIQTRSKSLRDELNSLMEERPKMEAPAQPDNLYPATPLTARELEVLGLVKEGLTNFKIGERLYISQRTVKFHMSAIFSKLHAKNRTEAVDIGLKRGLIGI